MTYYFKIKKHTVQNNVTSYMQLYRLFRFIVTIILIFFNRGIHFYIIIYKQYSLKHLI